MSRSETFFFAAFIAFAIVLFIIPVGGFCESNPLSEVYKTSFVTIAIILLTAIINLIYQNRKTTF